MAGSISPVSSRYKGFKPAALLVVSAEMKPSLRALER
jgi:hypothetical protein